MEKLSSLMHTCYCNQLLAVKSPFSCRFSGREPKGGWEGGREVERLGGWEKIWREVGR